MSQTQAEAAVMAQTAARFEAANETLQSMLRRLMGELEVLQTAWRGAGGRSFDQVRQAWAQDQERIARALLETASAIRTAGHQYTGSDTEAAHRVTATNRGGITLPL